MVAKRTKLTLNIDKEILKSAKKVAESKNTALSRMVETYMKFISDPLVWCFKCGAEFNASKSDTCPKCSYLRCPDCRACGCGLDEDTAMAVFQMRKVYEHLLGGRVK